MDLAFMQCTQPAMPRKPIVRKFFFSFFWRIFPSIIARPHHFPTTILHMEVKWQQSVKWEFTSSSSPFKRNKISTAKIEMYNTLTNPYFLCTFFGFIRIILHVLAVIAYKVLLLRVCVWGEYVDIRTFMIHFSAQNNLCYMEHGTSAIFLIVFWPKSLS